jgi:general stress protein 26
MEYDTHQESVKKLGELIKDVRVAMLTTIEPDGCLRSRPMATQSTEFDGKLWFLTDATSAKAHEVDRDHHVNLSYSKPDDQVYVSVSGMARLTKDRAKIEKLWSPIYKAFFPKGLEDPDLAALEVDVQKAEYWDSPSSKVVQLFGFVKALATGKRYGEEGSDHEELSLNS